MSRLLGLAFLLAATAPVLAQTSNSGAGIGPSQQVAQPRAETPALKNVPALRPTPMLATVPALAATAALPSVPALPATATLDHVDALPATALEP